MTNAEITQEYEGNDQTEETTMDLRTKKRLVALTAVATVVFIALGVLGGYIASRQGIREDNTSISGKGLSSPTAPRAITTTHKTTTQTGQSTNSNGTTTARKPATDSGQGANSKGTPNGTPKDTTPPALDVYQPKEGDVFYGANSTILVHGKTEADAQLLFNGSSLSVKPDGSFSRQVTLTAGANTITVTAQDKAGNKTTRQVVVTYKPNQVKLDDVKVKVPDKPNPGNAKVGQKCAYCAGTASVPCTSLCKGKGIYYTFDTGCPSCGGTGQVPGGICMRTGCAQVHACPTCGGTTMVQCPQCNGTGWTPQ